VVPYGARWMYFSLGTIAVVAGLDDFASVRESIKQRGGHLGIAEHGAPFAEGQVGGDDQRGPFVELADRPASRRGSVVIESQVDEQVLGCLPSIPELEVAGIEARRCIERPPPSAY